MAAETEMGAEISADASKEEVARAVLGLVDGWRSRYGETPYTSIVRQAHDGRLTVSLFTVSPELVAILRSMADG